MKLHILVISQYFYPENFRINDICKEWVKRGNEVTVITGIPNYPHGKFYSGYGYGKRRKEKYEGINIVRIPIIARGNNAITLMLNYFSYVISGFFWQMFTRIKADKVFIFEVSPMTQALVGVWYAKRRKIPCTIYVQDLWPENVEIVTGLHNKTAIKAIDKMVDYIYKNCDTVLATSPSFVKRLEERDSTWNKENSKVRYLPQYAEDFYKPSKKREMDDFPVEDIFRIVFTGNIGYAQGLSILPNVASVLKNQGIKCQFIIIGDGRYRDQFASDIKNAGVSDMFLLLGQKKPEEIPCYLACCDVAFISFADNELFEMTIPAKLQSYMACAMPILAVAGGETKRIVEEADCGVTCELGDVESCVSGINYLMNLSEKEYQNMSDNAIKYYIKNFSKDSVFELLDQQR